jgi:hypothetical protein
MGLGEVKVKGMIFSVLYQCEDGHLHSEQDVDWCDGRYVCPHNFEADTVPVEYVRVDWLRGEQASDAVKAYIDRKGPKVLARPWGFCRALADELTRLATPESEES